MVGLVLSVLLAGVADAVLVGVERIEPALASSAQGWPPVNFLSQVGHLLHHRRQLERALTGSPPCSLAQLKLSAVAVLAAVVVGVAARVASWATAGRGSFAVVNAANAARAIPSFALLTLLAIQPAIVRLQQGGFVRPPVTMFALAVPPVS